MTKLRSIRVATFNPGRLGFSQLGTAELLHWRLQAVAIELKSRAIQFCILPGARIPPGVHLPPDFPFTYYGLRTSSWGSVGVFVDCNFEDSFSPLDDYCQDRVFWFRLSLFQNNGGQGDKFQLIVCGFYHRPGGDLDTWKQMLKSFSELKECFPHAKFLFAGDSNTHFSF